nr:hypothetical protein [uncultured Jannaschia sp.]
MRDAEAPEEPVSPCLPLSIVPQTMQADLSDPRIRKILRKAFAAENGFAWQNLKRAVKKHCGIHTDGGREIPDRTGPSNKEAYAVNAEIREDTVHLLTGLDCCETTEQGQGRLVGLVRKPGTKHRRHIQPSSRRRFRTSGHSSAMNGWISPAPVRIRYNRPATSSSTSFR